MTDHGADRSIPQSDKNAYPRRPQVAVGAVVFHRGRVLLVRRGRPPAEGQWAIPGGSVELGEPLQRAAEREVYEETAVVIEASEPVFTFDVIERDSQNRIRFHYVIVDLAAEYVSGEPSAGDDAGEARWISAEEAETMALNAATRRLLADQFDFGRRR